MSNFLEPFAEAGQTRVLVVDDDPIFATIAQDYLSSAGYRASVAGDGVEALEMLDAHRYDIALIDLTMPRIDGFRLIALIRGAPRHRRLVIAVVTSRDDPESWSEARGLGANAVLSKPIHWPSFASRVEALLAEPSPCPIAVPA